MEREGCIIYIRSTLKSVGRDPIPSPRPSVLNRTRNQGILVHYCNDLVDIAGAQLRLRSRVYEHVHFDGNTGELNLLDIILLKSWSNKLTNGVSFCSSPLPSFMGTESSRRNTVTGSHGRVLFWYNSPV